MSVERVLPGDVLVRPDRGRVDTLRRVLQRHSEPRRRHHHRKLLVLRMLRTEKGHGIVLENSFDRRRPEPDLDVSTHVWDCAGRTQQTNIAEVGIGG